MIANILSFVVVIVLFLLFAWFTRRAWRARTPAVRWVGGALSGLLTLVLGLVTVLSLVGVVRFYAPRSNPVSEVAVAGTPEQLARGEQLAHTCMGCHSSNIQLPLDGGENFLGPLGVLHPPNLTPAGTIGSWSDGEIVRAIREGIHQSGRPLLIMPSSQFRHMSDEDVQAVVAYLRTQPPVENATPATSLSVLGATLVGAGVFPLAAQASITEPVVAPPAGVTTEYGEYLVNITGCRECHGMELTGLESSNGAPSGPNIRATVPFWSEQDFLASIREGVTPSGGTLDPEEMPWPEISATYSDDELRAIYMYISQLEPTETSSR